LLKLAPRNFFNIFEAAHIPALEQSLGFSARKGKDHPAATFVEDSAMQLA
jgi:hypothetical protein